MGGGGQAMMSVNVGVTLRAAGPWHTGVIYPPPRDDSKLVKGAWVVRWIFDANSRRGKIRKVFPAVKRKGRLSRPRAWVMWKSTAYGRATWTRTTEDLKDLWPIESLEGWAGLP